MKEINEVNIIYTLKYSDFVDAEFSEHGKLLWYDNIQYDLLTSAMIQYIFTGGA